MEEDKEMNINLISENVLEVVIPNQQLTLMDHSTWCLYLLKGNKSRFWFYASKS